MIALWYGVWLLVLGGLLVWFLVSPATWVVALPWVFAGVLILAGVGCLVYGLLRLVARGWDW